MEKQSHILVVDDDTDLCANLRKILEMLDYAVDIACNANDGMALCRATQYDIALVDIQLGADSGHDLVETLAPISPSTECIFMTGHASLESAIEAVKQAHVVSYETKPLNLDRLLALIKQIIKRKRVEEMLRQSEERFRRLAENARDMIYRTSLPDGTYEYASPAATEMFGYTPAEFLNSPLLIRKIIHPDWHEYFEVQWELLLAGKMPPSYEYQIVHGQSGETRWINQRNVLIRDDAGQPIAIEGIVTDITARKQAEEQIKTALKEKEVLLQEIHHRVKNNLQIISSLLDMSRLRTRDQEAIALLTDARARIHSMALIHTQLYQSKRFDHIDMQSHLRGLVGYLAGIYAERKMVTPRVEVSGVQLSLIQAIPCALILNELIANTFKHAFKEGQAGTLDITMQQSPDDTIVLCVKDDGIGICDDIDLEHTNTLGLKLIRKLVQQQLRGEIQVNRDAGTEFIITFKILLTNRIDGGVVR